MKIFSFISFTECPSYLYTKDKNNFCYHWGTKWREIFVSDLDVDTLDWESLSIIGLWQQFSFITNYCQPVQRGAANIPANSRDLILFVCKNWPNILWPEPGTISREVLSQAAGWLSEVGRRPVVGWSEVSFALIGGGPEGGSPW